MTCVNDDLSGHYHEDKGDVCTLVRRPPTQFHYRLTCTSGVKKTVDAGAICFWIRNGWYRKVADLDDKEREILLRNVL